MGHASMRTDGFNFEKMDELEIGSQFKRVRADELNHSVIHVTKSALNASGQNTLETFNQPNSTE